MLDWSSHTPYSDPGKHRDLLRQLPDDVDAICAAARNVIGHYRAELVDLPDETGEDDLIDRLAGLLLQADAGNRAADKTSLTNTPKTIAFTQVEPSPITHPLEHPPSWFSSAE